MRYLEKIITPEFGVKAYGYGYDNITGSRAFVTRASKYKIYDKDKAYFVTLTTVGWIDVFTRSNHKLKIIESLKCCQENKDLTVFG